MIARLDPVFRPRFPRYFNPVPKKHLTIILAACSIVFTFFYSVIDGFAETCSLPEGVVNIAIFGTGFSRMTTWFQDSLNSTALEFDLNENTNAYNSAGDKTSSSLPQHLVNSDSRLDVPYVISHNKNKLVAAVYPDRIVLLPSQHVVIIDLHGNKIVENIKIDALITSLAWSPSDNYLAVMVKKNVTSNNIPGPFDLLGSFLGHPVSYYDISVYLYDKNNQFLCHKKIAKNIRIGHGRIIDWVNK